MTGLQVEWTGRYCGHSYWAHRYGRKAGSGVSGWPKRQTVVVSWCPGARFWPPKCPGQMSLPDMPSSLVLYVDVHSFNQLYSEFDSSSTPSIDRHLLSRLIWPFFPFDLFRHIITNWSQAAEQLSNNRKMDAISGTFMPHPHGDVKRQTRAVRYRKATTVAGRPCYTISNHY